MAKPTVVSLFSGAGGLDYGLEAAGFRTKVAVELNGDCCETLRRNRPKWAVIERDIFDVPSSEILEKAECARGEIDLLVGGPPCQPFSKSSYWSKGDSPRLTDPRANTLSAYLRVLRDLQPRAFLLENVEGLAYKGKDEGLQLLIDAIDQINRTTGTQYRPVARIVNAADFGVPQVRKRLLLVAGREGETFEFPKATHFDPHSVEQAVGLSRYRTAWDAIGDVTPDRGEELGVRGRWADLLPSIPEGQNYLWHTNRMKGMPLFGWRTRYWSFLLKLAKNLPSWTVQAQPGPAIGPFHWENRRLSARELCRIQTFPDTVSIYGSRGSVQRQLGNAVPSLVAEIVGRSIRSQLLGHSLTASSPKLLPPCRVKVPPPERVGRVPARFHRLVGAHQDHPGSGLGVGAMRRAVG